MYNTLASNDDLAELLNRKEFYQYKRTDRNFREGEGVNYLVPASYQSFISNVMHPTTGVNRLFILWQPGCHAADTMVMRFNGSLARADEIKLGDRLAGPSKSPRTVFAISRGIDRMYRITFDDEKKYFDCNEGHILHLIDVGKFKTVNIDVREVMKNSVKNYKLIDTRGKMFDFDIKLKSESEQYFGFSVDHDNLYLLEHEIITHNSGKTLLCVETAKSHVAQYKTLYNKLASEVHLSRQVRAELDFKTPSVFIIGGKGTKTAFYRDFLKYPELGFLSWDELDNLTRLRTLSERGLQNDIKNYKMYQSSLQRRITSKSRGGFFKFFGFQVLVNRLFITDLNLIDIEAEAHSRILNGENITIEGVFDEYIEQRKIRVNTELLEIFKNSLIIVDEAHHIYNSTTKNNYGVAIHYILRKYPKNKILFLTATPFNNSPTEIVEIMDFLGTKTTKSQLFRGTHLLPGAHEIISKAVFGHISFLQDINPRYFPSMKFVGDDLVLKQPYLDYKSGDKVEFLKFIKCKMSSLHLKTLNKLMIEGDAAKAEGDQEEIEIYEDIGGVSDEYPYAKHSIGITNYNIYDVVFPNPNDKNIGILGQVREQLVIAPQEWKDEIGIKIINERGTIRYGGEFLAAGKLAKSSGKYAELVNTIIKIIRSQGDIGEKIMIYHENVVGSGVLFIQEVLLANGFLDDMMEPIQDTICGKCGKALKQHNDVKHDFNAARFLIVHSKLDSSQFDNNLLRFSSPNNSQGDKFKILIGSKIIKESHDVKDVRHQLITRFPVSMPALKQIIGRCVRKNSHANLPPHARNVSIYLFTYSIDGDDGALDKHAPEEYRYIEKITSYKTIQEIERIMNAGAIDADINRDIVMSDEIKKLYVDGKTFNTMYFEPEVQIKNKAVGELNQNTFTVLKYFVDEQKWISYLIKRIMSKYTILTYSELWNKVREPEFSVEINPKMFTEGNFIIVLQMLLKQDNMVNEDESDNIISINKKSQMQSFVESFKKYNKLERVLQQKQESLIAGLFDINEKYIYIGNQKHNIKQLGDYFILVKDNKLDVETYQRNLRMTYGESVNLSEINIRFEENQLLKDYIAQFAQGVNINILTIPINIQTAMLRLMISEKFDAKDQDFYESLADFYSSMHALITSDDVLMYKNVLNLFNKRPDSGVIIGYLDTKNVQLYDASADTWLSVDKVSLNRQIEYKEIGKYIGYVEDVAGSLKFKVRPAITKVKDLRSAERGSVCETKNKDLLIKIAKELGIYKVSQPQRVLFLCNAIKQKLVSLDNKERDKDTKIKYFYHWWDNLPTQTKD